MKKRFTCVLTDSGTKFDRFQNYSVTLRARDYKGLDNFGSSAVIEVIETFPDLIDYRNNIATVIGGIGEKKSNNNTQYYQQDRIYDGRKTIEVCCSAQLPNGSNLFLFEVKKKRRIVSMRGRNPKNPSDRKKADEYIQRLEFNKQGICNTLTTVDKDNYLLEIVG